MFSLRRFAWTSLFLVPALAAAMPGCAEAEPAGDSEDIGLDEDELVAERQLNGSELPSKTLVLTFDDGPSARTVELSDYLASQGIKATFFINGKNVAGRQKAIDSIVGRGHQLANHTQNHAQLTKLSAANVVKEVTETDRIIAQADSNGPWLLRAPYGAWNGATANAVNGSAMKKYVGGVFWDVGGELTSKAAADWACWGQGVSVDRCAALYQQEANSKKKGIVLMHDAHSKTIDMVKVLVPKLKADGFTFAKLEDVPSVKRAIGAGGTGGSADEPCYSATLGKTMPENACVQSRSNEVWYRCIDGEWIRNGGPSDPKCISKTPLK